MDLMLEVFWLKLIMIMKKDNILFILLQKKVNTVYDLGMKFWIGGAAQTANNAVVWAQLYIK